MNDLVTNILLVDDNAEDRMLYRRYLGKHWKVGQVVFREASTGDEAQAQFLAHRPDCVLLDHQLPDTDGLSLLAQLLQLAPPDSLCVVMVTGVGNEALAVRTLQSGALDYLVKQQFDAETLCKTVVHALEKNEWRQATARHHHDLRLVNHELRESLAALLGTRQVITARNTQLTAANAELARTNVDLDNFIYTASHDLRTPITNIEGLLLALLDELPALVRQAPNVQPLLVMMQGAVDRFKHTIDELTTVIKLQQAHTLRAEAIDVVALIEAVRLDLAPQLAAAGGQLTVDATACPGVLLAPKHLRSVLYNLLSNAIKYAAPTRLPRVQLRCHPGASGGAVLTVQDNGLGLDAGQQAKLFGMFRRLHTHVEGSGIGLYMVKKIVENVGGTVTVDSQLGVGSTFTVRLPG